jgi:hypothetical protein
MPRRHGAAQWQRDAASGRPTSAPGLAAPSAALRDARGHCHVDCHLFFPDSVDPAPLRHLSTLHLIRVERCRCRCAAPERDDLRLRTDSAAWPVSPTRCVSRERVLSYDDGESAELTAGRETRTPEQALPMMGSWQPRRHARSSVLVVVLWPACAPWLLGGVLRASVLRAFPGVRW